jgi:hypothetical protein
MSTIVKASALAVYLLAVVGAFVVLPFGIGTAVQGLAIILLVLHALEVLIAFKYLRQYPGPLVDSVALTLLFGFLHWKPLTKRS